MFNLLQLQQERAHKSLLARDLVEKSEKADGGPRPLSTEELGLFDKLESEIKTLDDQILAIQAHEARRAKAQALVDKLEAPAGRQTAPEQPGTMAASGTTTTTDTRIPVTARRTSILKAFKPKAGESVNGAELRAFRAGMWARATLFGSHKAQQWCMSNGIALDIRGAMGTNSNTDGGFLVADEMAQAIIDLREQYGVFRRNCRVWPMGSDTLQIPRRATGVTVGALGENPASAPSGTTPTFDMVTLVAKKCGGLSVLSSEISEDAVIDLADWLANEWAYAFAYFEDQCGFIGDGTSTYLGIRGLGDLLTEAGGLAGAVQVATATHNLFTEIDVPDLSALMAKLPQYARMNAKFYCSAVCNDLVFGRLKAQGGGNTNQTLQQGNGDSYLGYPIVISQVLPAGSSTDYNGLPMLYFGDLSKSSSLGDRRKVRVFASEHRNMDLDQITILGTERIDIVNHDVGTTTAAGPIVALVGSSS